MVFLFEFSRPHAAEEHATSFHPPVRISYPNATNRSSARSHVKACIDKGGVATGLLLLGEGGTTEMPTKNKSAATPLVDLQFSQLCPGSKSLQELMGEYR